MLAVQTMIKPISLSQSVPLFMIKVQTHKQFDSPHGQKSIEEFGYKNGFEPT